MQQDPKDIILQVLMIIGYEDNKDTYAVEFLQNCEKQALLDLLPTLPKEKQDEFKQKTLWAKDEDRQKAVINEYITPEQYQAALQKASATAFEGLLEEIIPTLSNNQADNLQSYLQSLAPLNVPAYT